MEKIENLIKKVEVKIQEELDGFRLLAEQRKIQIEKQVEFRAYKESLQIVLNILSQNEGTRNKKQDLHR